MQIRHVYTTKRYTGWGSDRRVNKFKKLCTKEYASPSDTEDFVTVGYNSNCIDCLNIILPRKKREYERFTQAYAEALAITSPSASASKEPAPSCTDSSSSSDRQDIVPGVLPGGNV